MSIFQRLQDVLGIGEYDDEYDEAYNYGGASPYPEPYGQSAGEQPRQRGAGGVSSNVVGMPGLPGGNPEVILMEPRTFDEIPKAVQALKERKSVILNLGLMEPEQAQRAADYVAGGAYAVDGHQERLGEQIFLFTPNFVQISSYNPQEAVAPPNTTMLTQPTPPGRSPWVGGGATPPQF
ncbi:MAG: cell division protein SepF [Cyanobacteria bacterium J06638_22]